MTSQVNEITNLHLGIDQLDLSIRSNQNTIVDKVSEILNKFHHEFRTKKNIEDAFSLLRKKVFGHAWTSLSGSISRVFANIFGYRSIYDKAEQEVIQKFEAARKNREFQKAKSVQDFMKYSLPSSILDECNEALTESALSGGRETFEACLKQCSEHGFLRAIDRESSRSDSTIISRNNADPFRVRDLLSSLDQASDHTAAAADILQSKLLKTLCINPLEPSEQAFIATLYLRDIDNYALNPNFCFPPKENNTSNETLASHSVRCGGNLIQRNMTRINTNDGTNQIAIRAVYKIVYKDQENEEVFATRQATLKITGSFNPQTQSKPSFTLAIEELSPAQLTTSGEALMKLASDASS